jgi:hypothetical protein
MQSEDKAGEFQRGLRAFRNGDYETAVKHLSQAVEYDENNHRAWNALGTACAKVTRYTDADLCFENALTLEPDNPLYQKNQNTNAKHLKKPPLIVAHSQGSILDHPPFDKIPFDLIPIERKFVAAGAAGLLIIIIILLTLSGVIFTSPPEPSGPPLSLSVNLSGDSIVLINEGGTDIGQISSFTWKINEIAIGTGEPGDPGTLGVTPGAVARVPLTRLLASNLSNEMRVMVIAHYKEGGAMVALDTRLPPPPRELLPTVNKTPEITPTPTPVPDVPKFREGEVIIDKSLGTYWIIIAPPVNSTYTTAPAARVPDGTFTAIDTTATTISMKTLEQTATSIGLSTKGGTATGIAGLTPPPVTGVPTLHPEPIYAVGDLVNSRKTGDEDMMVILGYDPASDQYQADNLHRYYTGEWGYRPTDISKWYFRPTLEQQNPHRIGRITLSDVGIGADSSPPRTPVKYGPGDIISPDKAGIDKLHVIITYRPEDDMYETDIIRPAYDGGWIRTGTTIMEKRAFVERDNPYNIRRVDLTRVRIG